VTPNCSVPGHPNIFVIGDAMSLKDKHGNALPGVAQVAMQQGKFVARIITSQIKGVPSVTIFKYFDKGTMATIGKRLAVAKIGPIEICGVLAWLSWAVIHIFYLIGLSNKLLVMIHWIWAYLFSQRGARLITGRKV
jgi:NADH:ubiquinone reductase (H+-translocating)